jgi:hypothetical protein
VVVVVEAGNNGVLGIPDDFLDLDVDVVVAVAVALPDCVLGGTLSPVVVKKDKVPCGNRNKGEGHSCSRYLLEPTKCCSYSCGGGGTL